MKKLLNNKEDFKNWRLHYFNDILNSYDECEPKEYPCVGSYVELIEGVNCYYDDEKIDEFISLCYKNLGKDIKDINVNGI